MAAKLPPRRIGRAVRATGCFGEGSSSGQGGIRSIEKFDGFGTYLSREIAWSALGRDFGGDVDICPWRERDDLQAGVVARQMGEGVFGGAGRQ